MPSLRAQVSQKEVMDYTNRETRADLSVRLRRIAALRRKEKIENVEMLWQPFADADNALPFALDVMFSLNEGEVATREEMEDFRDELLLALKDAQELPANIEVGVWIIPLPYGLWGQTQRTSWSLYPQR